MCSQINKLQHAYKELVLFFHKCMQYSTNGIYAKQKHNIVLTEAI